MGDKVGKTTLLNALRCDGPVSRKDDNIIYKFKVDNYNEIELSLYEIPRNNSDSVLKNPLYKNADAAIIMYDITNESSFKSLRNWIKKLKSRKRLNKKQKQIAVTIVGNKYDLPSGDREVTLQCAKNFANSYHYQFIEVSALMNINIERLFQDICRQLFEKYHSSATRKDIEFDVTMVGNSSVGKTLIIRNALNESFEGVEVTTGIDHKLYQYNLKDDDYVVLRISDTSGTERFKSIIPQFYRKANAIILVYDITDRKSYLSLKEWTKEIKNYSPEDLVLTLVGNKYDLSHERAVSKEETEYFSKTNGFMYFETSAKHGTDIDNLFHAICNRLFINNLYKKDQANTNNTIRVHEDKSNNNNSRLCNC